MDYGIIANLVVVIHFAFVIFVVLGGIPAIWFRKIIWLHIPAVIWGAFVEFSGWICPLTPLEISLRIRAGDDGYALGFVDNYLLPFLYPENLTREVQIVIGISVILINLLIYWRVLRNMMQKRLVDKGI